MNNKYWTIKAKANNEAEILIYEVIGQDYYGDGITSKTFAQELSALGNVNKISLRINSPGGDVFEGNAIYNILKGHKAKIEVYIDGIAASIASVIAMAGNTIYMPQNSIMMIHDPWSVVAGTAEDMRKSAEALDKVKNSIVASYRNKTRLDESQIINLMSEETWMNADEAVQRGFADILIEPVKVAAKYDLSMYKNKPKNIFANESDELERNIKCNARKREIQIAETETETETNKRINEPYNPISAANRKKQLNDLDWELDQSQSRPNHTAHDIQKTNGRRKITFPARRI